MAIGDPSKKFSLPTNFWIRAIPQIILFMKKQYIIVPASCVAQLQLK